MSRELKGAVISAMAKDGAFRNEGYRLHEEFTGDYNVKSVVSFANTRSKNNEHNAFRVECSSESGKHSMNGYLFANAYLVPKGTKLDDVKSIKEDIKKVFYWEDAQDVVRQSRHVNSEMEEGQIFKFPEKFKVLGAVVSKDQKEDHPYVPLRRYPFYNTILKHHRETADEDATYVDRDTIDMYLNSEGDNRPRLPENYEFKLRNHEEAVWKMDNWNPTLLIEDWTEADES